MNMEDILNQWDAIQSEKKKKSPAENKNQVSHKKANAPTKEEKELAAERDFEEKIRQQNSRKINRFACSSFE